MKLNSSNRNWIFYNIKRFHKEDRYLKNLDTNIILSQFKTLLNESSDLNELLEKLSDDMFSQEFCFYRKEGKYFIYPSFHDQVKSLVECWEELYKIYSNIYNGKENEYEAFEEEPFLNAKFSSKKITRNSFGNKINLNSLPKMHGEHSLHSHLMSTNRYIKSSFKYEYSFFKKRCIEELEKLSKINEDYDLFFYQTDLKSFFHNIDIEDALRILSKYDAKNLKKWIRYIGDKFPQAGLPIGWMLSGLIADLVFMEFEEFFCKVSSAELSKIQVAKFTMINYVDDIIYIIKATSKCDKDELHKKFSMLVQLKLDSFFKKDTVQIHDSDSVKVTFEKLDKLKIKTMDSHWHNFEILVSGDNEQSSTQWSVLDEFLLPFDNDLVFNENVQFFQNLKNLKKKIEEDEFKNYSEFEDVFAKIKYKISLDKKYLPSVIDTLLRFEKNVRNVDSKPRYIDQFIVFIFNDVDDLTIIDIIGVLSTLSRFKSDLSFMDDLIISLTKRSVKLFANSCYSMSEDRFLFYCWLKQNTNIAVKLNDSSNIYFVSETENFIEILKAFKGKDSFSIRNYSVFGIIFKRMNKEEMPLKFKFLKTLKRCLAGKRGEVKARALEQIFSNGGYLILPHLSEDELVLLNDYLKAIKPKGEVFLEIRWLAENLGAIQRNWDDFRLIKEDAANFLNNFTKVKNKNKKSSLLIPKCVENEIKVISAYREISMALIYSLPDIRDFIKFILFQYVPVESFVFFSWNSLPSLFNGISPTMLKVVKAFLETKISGPFYSKKISIQADVPEFALCKRQGEISLTKVEISDIEQTFNEKQDIFNSEKIKVMICNVGIKISDFNEKNFGRLNQASVEKSHLIIMESLRYAKRKKCNVVCIPELTLSDKYLLKYLDFCGDNNLILIGGREYQVSLGSRVSNVTIISFPVSKRGSPVGKKYIAFEQKKNFLAIDEYAFFNQVRKKMKKKIKLVVGNEINIFSSEVVSNFSILTCSDFLSLEIKYLIQGLVQSVFVPAMNFDNTTYFHLAQSAIRELYCYCVICNNNEMGSSLICAPYREEFRRSIFRIEGKSIPNFHAIEIEPALIKELQESGEDHLLKFKDNEQKVGKSLKYKLKDFKQPPPDWYKIRKSS